MITCIFVTVTCIYLVHVMVLNDHMHICGACDGSEQSHAYLWCMWWFWMVTCIYLVHVMVLNDHMHFFEGVIYSIRDYTEFLDMSLQIYQLRFRNWEDATVNTKCTTNMHVTVQNHHMHHKYACDRSEPSHAP